jgi:hypothetical protein
MEPLPETPAIEPPAETPAIEPLPETPAEDRLTETPTEDPALAGQPQRVAAAVPGWPEGSYQEIGISDLKITSVREYPGPRHVERVLYAGTRRRESAGSARR